MTRKYTIEEQLTILMNGATNWAKNCNTERGKSMHWCLRLLTQTNFGTRPGIVNYIELFDIIKEKLSKAFDKVKKGSFIKQHHNCICCSSNSVW